jgi:IclR family transcriptional regulator, pca regulon regulatory protein
VTASAVIVSTYEISTIDRVILISSTLLMEPPQCRSQMAAASQVDFGNRGQRMEQRVSSSGRREVMGGLAKGLGVLRTFSRTRPHMTLSEIAARAGLPAATARRCLNTLEELGYVTRNGRQFLLRPRVLEIGAVYLDSMNIDLLTRTHLEEIAGESGDSAALAVLSGTNIVYVARASARTTARAEAHVGSQFPAFATSLGRVLLAGLTPESLESYFSKAKLESFTPKTVTNRAELERIIADVRRNGYAVVDEELAPGVVSLGVPVHDASGRVVAALNISSHPRQTTAAALLSSKLAALQRVSKAISAEIINTPGLALSAQV